MIDSPEQVTPEGLRNEARALRYSGRDSAATRMEWAADKIEKLEKELEIAKGFHKDAVLSRDREIRRTDKLEKGLRNCDRYSYFGVGEVCDPDPQKPEWIHEDNVLALLGDDDG